MRLDLADEVRACKTDVAMDVTARFLAVHPDWSERYGERARIRGEEDAAHHVDFLAAAIELERPSAFVDYVRWCAGVLERRGIARSFLDENLEQVEQAVGARVSEGTAAVVRDTVAAGRSALAQEPGEAADSAADDELALALRLYVDAATRGRRKAALGVVRELLQGGRPLLQLYVSFFQEALYEVGRLWAADTITVAEEHMATATTQYVLGVLYEDAPPATVARGAALVTGVEGELHQVGANIVADALDCDGWDVRFLGTNMPHPSILAVVDTHRPRLLGISAGLVTSTPRVRDLIADVRDRCGDAPPWILVGGRAFRTEPELWREVGADGFAADVGAAVDAARAL